MRRMTVLCCLLLVMALAGPATAAPQEAPDDVSGLTDLLDAEDVEAAREATPPAQTLSHLEVVAEDLDNPRGMEFGADGALYVAESGTGGDDCATLEEEFEGEVFEFQVCTGPTGAVTRIDDGEQERVATGLPSYTFVDPEDPEAESEVFGPHDVSVGADGELYVPVGLFATQEDRDAIAAQVGDLADNFATLARVDDGEVSYVADFAAFEVEQNPDADQPLSNLESNPYAVLAEDDSQVVIDASGNTMLRVSDGDITTEAVFPDRFVTPPPFFELPPDEQIPIQSVPTGVVEGPDGAYYVSDLPGIFGQGGDAAVWRVETGEDPEIHADGFTTAIDLDFGPDGSLYVLQFVSSFDFVFDEEALPMSSIVRVAPDGTRTTVASEGLLFSTGLEVGPDGAIYVTNCGNLCGPGAGQVLRIESPLAVACPEGEVPSAGFPDVSGVHAGSIDCLAWWNITRGYEDGTYRPQLPVRRDQMASFIVRTMEAAGYVFLTPTPQGFTDIEGNTHAQAINQLRAAGVVSGTTATTYSPAANIRRDQMASLLWRAHRVLTGEELATGTEFFDDVPGTNVHRDAINALAARGVVQGRGGRQYGPAASVTRAQMASFLMGYVNELVHLGVATPPEQD